MSVNKTDYVLVGIKLPFMKIPNDFDEEDGVGDSLEKYYDDTYKDKLSEELVIVSDGMGGCYTFIGKVIDRSCDYEGLKIINAIEEFQKHYNDVKDKFWKHENEMIRSHAGKEISIYVFSHCS